MLVQRTKHSAKKFNDSECECSEAVAKDPRVWDGGVSVPLLWKGSCYCTSPLNIQHTIEELSTKKKKGGK